MGMRMKKQAREAKEAAFKRLYGVKPDTFEKMKDILQKAFNKLHQAGGRPPKLTVAEKLAATLKYLREYRTMESIAADYGVAKSRISETIRWVEDTLAKDKTFKLPGKKALENEGSPIKYIVVDVTESPINRPKKNKKSGIRAKRSGTL
jgi:transcription initiation factor TFIIIB Brf1 subunit/transcription initiation factor TFIIB